MKKIKELLFLFGILILAQGCQTSHINTIDPMALFEIDSHPYFADEFEFIFKKNQYGEDTIYSRQSVDNYLELFINFKLKVLEAKSLGYDTTSSFKKEFETYKDQLASPYLSQNKVSDKLVEQAYQRSQKEINASHLLVKVSPGATADDTLSAYKLAKEIYEKATSGNNFEELIAQYTQNHKDMVIGENLGYFSAMQMVYPFENAAYNTIKGGISDIVRTQFGYHLIKINDIRKARGNIQVSHILLNIPRGSSREDSVKIKEKIFEIRQRLTDGENWDDLCSRFSDDANTKNKGGLLPEFNARNVMPSFAEVCYSLKNPGEISAPFTTLYGWHIVKLEKKFGLKSFEELKPALRNRVLRDSRSQLGKDQVISKLKKENNLLEHGGAKDIAWRLIQTEATSNPDQKNSLLFSISDTKFFINDFLIFIDEKMEGKDISHEKFEILYQTFLENKLLEHEKLHLGEKYPEYKMLEREYREGILLFQIMENMVWNRASLDSAGISNYYESNKSKYFSKEKAKFITIETETPEIHKQIGNRLKGIEPTSLNSDSAFHKLKTQLENEFNSKSNLTLQVLSGWVEKDGDPVFDNLTWNVGKYEKSFDGKFYWILFTEKDPKRLNALEDIKGLVISDYQKEIEKNWINELRIKHNVKINNRKLKEIYENLEAK